MKALKSTSKHIINKYRALLFTWLIEANLELILISTDKSTFPLIDGQHGGQYINSAIVPYGPDLPLHFCFDNMRWLLIDITAFAYRPAIIFSKTSILKS